MNQKQIEKRISEFRKIIDARMGKNECGIFVIPASIPRLFAGVLEQDGGVAESDAIAVWDSYLSEIES